jgi:prepilin-type N-terminal cleavage/methylation domain-containing protein
MISFASSKQGIRGFTLIELLIVIGIIGILAAIVLVSVDPAKRLRQARNARRFAESNALLNAILNYTVDFKGTLPSAISGSSANAVLLLGAATTTPITATVCPNHVTGAGTATAIIDLGSDTAFVDPYIPEIPIDPRGSNGTDTYSAALTGYYLKRSTSGRIEIGACNPESEDNITTPQIKVKR